MAKKSDFTNVEVAALTIVRGGRILAVYNPQWGAYTLPMTKRHEWENPTAGGLQQEAWEEAAVRAYAEHVCGITTNVPALLVDVPEYQQSDREGVWKRYHFQVFRMPFEDADRVVDDARSEWLTAAEFADPTRRPISKTARDLVAKAEAEAKLHGRPFP